MAGRLVLVATPIGNLSDLSPRAVETLADVALVCCEDTRRTGRLLQHAGLTGKRLAVCNEHTETARVDEVIGVLAGGSDVAVVTDAGTPGISDPGERLAKAVLDAGYEVTAVPGPAAFVTAAIISGLPTTRLVFEGFIPRSGAGRRERLAEIAADRRTVVLYEAPHRIERTISDLIGVCGPDRDVAVVRELTKLYETVVRGTLGSIDLGTPRGEYVVVLGPAGAPGPPSDDEVDAAIDVGLAAGQSNRDLAAELSARFGLSKRLVYEQARVRKAGLPDSTVEGGHR